MRHAVYVLEYLRYPCSITTKQNMQSLYRIYIYNHQLWMAVSSRDMTHPCQHGGTVINIIFYIQVILTLQSVMTYREISSAILNDGEWSTWYVISKKCIRNNWHSKKLILEKPPEVAGCVVMVMCTNTGNQICVHGNWHGVSMAESISHRMQLWIDCYATYILSAPWKTRGLWLTTFGRYHLYHYSSYSKMLHVRHDT